MGENAQTMSEKAKGAGKAAKPAGTKAVEPRNDAAAGERSDATAGELAAVKRAEAAEQKLQEAEASAGAFKGQLDTFGKAVVMAAMNVASRFAPKLELAPTSAEESAQDHGLRLLDALAALTKDEGETDRVAELEGLLADRGTELDNVREDLRKANEAAAASASRADRADRARLTAQRPKVKSSKARKVGEMQADGVDRELMDKLMDAGEDELELVFTDGQREVVELEPIAVYPAAFRRARAGKFMLNDALEVRATMDGIALAGVALLDSSGKQVAYSPLIEPVTMHAGQRRKFDNLIF